MSPESTASKRSINSEINRLKGLRNQTKDPGKILQFNNQIEDLMSQRNDLISNSHGFLDKLRPKMHQAAVISENAGYTQKGAVDD